MFGRNDASLKTNSPYRLKYSVYSRLYRYKQNHSLNPNPPGIEVIVYEILPIDHPGFLSFEEFNDVDERIISETSQFWESDVLS
ncbi:MAG: hypothetical protein WBZ36_15755 [Candidatus Nitrosopolaris sp.]